MKNKKETKSEIVYTEIEELEEDPIDKESKSFAEFLKEAGKKFELKTLEENSRGK